MIFKTQLFCLFSDVHIIIRIRQDEKPGGNEVSFTAIFIQLRDGPFEIRQCFGYSMKRLCQWK